MVPPEEFWNLVGFILAGENRRKVMFCLEKGYATPKQISTSCNLRIGHVSNILISLKDKELVYCRNPDAKRGRIYSLTELGEEIMSSIKKAGSNRSPQSSKD
ncbi:MAG: ArsR family transcriptional regulator [Methanomassiliicoccales archaeon]|nr:MAG: ArsR family transcriptional regulator [Methanomassiliicoccales archaeon]